MTTLSQTLYQISLMWNCS